MRVFAWPNAFGLKLAAFAALSTLFGTAVAQTAATAPATGTAATGTKVEYDHKHPLPTTQEIPASLPSVPSAQHPSASQAQSATLPQK